MEAYALVDTSTRRKMDEMLKTWKEPVPGSIDTRPVFPPEVTRPIETALIKARTSAVQAQQEQLRSQQQMMSRGRPIPSPTPPQGPPGVARPPMQGAPGYPSNFNQQQYPPPQPYGSQVNGQQPQPQSQVLPPVRTSLYMACSFIDYFLATRGFITVSTTISTTTNAPISSASYTIYSVICSSSTSAIHPTNPATISPTLSGTDSISSTADSTISAI
jgi:hypothetical protein